MKKIRLQNLKLILFGVLLFSTCILLSIYTWRIKQLQKNFLSEESFLTETEEYEEKLLPFFWEDKLKSKLRCHNRPLVMEKVQYGHYWLLRNYIRGRQSVNIGCAESITYATNTDYTFFRNIPNLIVRWFAPVSVAIFAPGYDFNVTLSCIQYIRNCVPESYLIRDFVTFHIYFPRRHLPKYVPLTEKEALLWPYNCSSINVPYENVNRSQMYKTNNNLLYPINVGRNIARQSSNTYFILTSDVELYPSVDFVSKFLTMIYYNLSLISNAQHPRVFPLPVFELEHNAIIPDNKQELLSLLVANMAFPFHWNICRRCHLVPGYKQWLLAEDTGNMEVIANSKRQKSYANWEPFYISDNQEPPFDERLSWEGQSNKRIQNYAMCLLNYEYFVLHPAFLVHAPGIKHFNKKDPRLKFVPDTNDLIDNQIKLEYLYLYGYNRNCKV